MKKERITILSSSMLTILLIALCALSLGMKACSRSNSASKEFTEADMVAVRTVLKEVDPTAYRAVLPEFNNGRIVGSQTFGTLPLTEVTRVASSQGVRLADTGNLQVIVMSTQAGNSMHPANGKDAILTIERIMKNKDKSKYVFLVDKTR